MNGQYDQEKEDDVDKLYTIIQEKNNQIMEMQGYRDQVQKYKNFFQENSLVSLKLQELMQKVDLILKDSRQNDQLFYLVRQIKDEVVQMSQQIHILNKDFEYIQSLQKNVQELNKRIYEYDQNFVSQNLQINYQQNQIRDLKQWAKGVQQRQEGQVNQAELEQLRAELKRLKSEPKKEEVTNEDQQLLLAQNQYLMNSLMQNRNYSFQNKEAEEQFNNQQNDLYLHMKSMFEQKTSRLQNQNQQLKQQLNQLQSSMVEQHNMPIQLSHNLLSQSQLQQQISLFLQILETQALLNYQIQNKHNRNISALLEYMHKDIVQYQEQIYEMDKNNII